MKVIGVWILGLFIVGLVCSHGIILASSQQKHKAIVDSIETKALKEDSLTPMEKTLRSIPKNVKLVFGYRFTIRGDFDGDGRQDTLTEHYISSLDGKETNKFYDNLDNYGQQVALTVHKHPVSFVTSNSKGIDTLLISRDLQLLGLLYLKNEGDLDGDGADELSYVVNWAAWSSVNTWYLMSYKKHKWVELYSFTIRDWQLPRLPYFSKEYGMFGVSGTSSTGDNDSENKQIEKELLAFPGFVRKIRKNIIHVTYVTDAAEPDTGIVDLRQIKKKKE